MSQSTIFISFVHPLLSLPSPNFQKYVPHDLIKPNMKKFFLTTISYIAYFRVKPRWCKFNPSISLSLNVSLEKFTYSLLCFSITHKEHVRTQSGIVWRDLQGVRKKLGIFWVLLFFQLYSFWICFFRLFSIFSAIIHLPFSTFALQHLPFLKFQHLPLPDSIKDVYWNDWSKRKIMSQKERL